MYPPRLGVQLAVAIELGADLSGLFIPETTVDNPRVQRLERFLVDSLHLLLVRELWGSTHVAAYYLTQGFVHVWVHHGLHHCRLLGASAEPHTFGLLFEQHSTMLHL